MTNRKTQLIQIRVSACDLEQIDRRVPKGLCRSSWLRNLALGQPVLRARAKPRFLVAAPLNAAELAQVRALSSAAASISELARHLKLRSDPQSHETAEKLRELHGHVRTLILAK